MSTLNTVGMQSLKRLCISNQWNPKRSQQTQLQGIKCMVPFFQSQTFERRFPCYQDIWGTDFRTSGGANKTVTQICNQSRKALLTAHHVTRRLPKALHMTQATASMGIRLDSETTQMNTQKPKQEWKKITLSQSCLIFEDITTTRSRYHYYGSPGFQVVNDLIISGKTGEKFWCDVPFVEHCLQQRPRIQVLRTVVQARLSHRKHKPTIATLHCNMDMMSQVWNFQVIFHGEHVWSNLEHATLLDKYGSLDSNQNIDSKFKFTAIDAWYVGVSYSYHIRRPTGMASPNQFIVLPGGEILESWAVILSYVGLWLASVQTMFVNPWDSTNDFHTKTCFRLSIVQAHSQSW